MDIETVEGTLQIRDPKTLEARIWLDKPSIEKLGGLRALRADGGVSNGYWAFVPDDKKHELSGQKVIAYGYHTGISRFEIFRIELKTKKD